MDWNHFHLVVLPDDEKILTRRRTESLLTFLFLLNWTHRSSYCSDIWFTVDDELFQNTVSVPCGELSLRQSVVGRAEEVKCHDKCICGNWWHYFSRGNKFTSYYWGNFWLENKTYFSAQCFNMPMTRWMRRSNFITLSKTFQFAASFRWLFRWSKEIIRWQRKRNENRIL